jgi:hypothetical protein
MARQLEGRSRGTLARSGGRSMSTSTRFERGLALAGPIVVAAVLSTEVWLERRKGVPILAAIVVEAIMITLALRSLLRWRRGSTEQPSFAWFVAIAYPSYLLFLIVAGIVMGPRPQGAPGGLLGICALLGIVVALVGVQLLKRAARSRVDQEFTAWKRATEVPPPPVPLE